MVDKEAVMKELEKVVDPEIGVPITEMQLVDTIDIQDGNVTVEFHITTPFCPPVFALKMATDIKTLVSKLEGVKSVKVNVNGHYMSEQINKQINAEKKA
ncbi:MAG: iron-sulfur cluster assembly protein [Candidatus Aenigmarchaeota archaeon]|nr:iron-sulfur cluster assembly protein [Candidatus Aenigmarchaeota archaeon]